MNHYAIYNEILLSLVLSWISMDSSMIEQNIVSWYGAVATVIVNAIVIVNFSILYGGQSLILCIILYAVVIICYVMLILYHMFINIILLSVSCMSLWHWCTCIDAAKCCFLYNNISQRACKQ